MNNWKKNRYRKSYLPIMVFMVGFLISTVILDRTLGLFIDIPYRGIVLPSNTEATYVTPEFTFTAYINNLGFRDNKLKFIEQKKYRIIVIGDSFTYGWGVDIYDSWPKVLERNLVDDGFDVEVVNLGLPGATPVDYADIAERTIPLLKPDMVIIAILQGDDLAQLARYKKKERPITLRQTIKNLYPNIIGIIRNDSESKTITAEQITQKWKEYAKDIIEQLTLEQKTRFGSVNSRIKKAYINGELDAHQLALAVEHPDHFSKTLDINQPDVKKLILQMSEQLSRIKNIADRCKSKVIVISVPHLIYVSERGLKSVKEIGIFVDSSMLVTDSADKAIEMASSIANIPFFKCTEGFRKESQQTKFYFELDHHFNVLGCRFYAGCLTPILEDLLRDRI